MDRWMNVKTTPSNHLPGPPNAVVPWGRHSGIGPERVSRFGRAPRQAVRAAWMHFRRSMWPPSVECLYTHGSYRDPPLSMYSFY